MRSGRRALTRAGVTRTGALPRTVIAAIVVAVAATGSLVPRAGADREASADCRFSAAERTLAVRVLHNASFDFLTLDRKGDAIRVLDNSAPIRCAGGVPDVHNTDSVSVSNEAGAGEATLFIEMAPPFTPGATDEGDGSSEIELSVDFRRADSLAGGGGSAFFEGTRGSDEITLGEGPGGRAVNLNATEPTPDADVELGEKVEFVLFSGDGGDSIKTPGGGQGFTGPYPGTIHIFAEGGADTIQGTSNGEGDIIGPGRGRDLVDAKGGSDFITARDHARDRVDCGPGIDDVSADRSDRLRHCEHVEHRKPRKLARAASPRQAQARLLRVRRASILGRSEP